jgi:hypothetical protein
VVFAVVIGSRVAVGLGVFGKVHDPRFFSVNVAGFSSPTAVKSWLATLAVSLARSAVRTVCGLACDGQTAYSVFAQRVSAQS